MSFTRLTLLRHGESVWNKENRFTGWADVPLSENGFTEARRAAAWMRGAGLTFDVAFTSRLRRAIQTLWLVLDEMDLMWLPQHNDWRLNERHYGALQGLNKAETAARYGDEQVRQWRRSYVTAPPPAAAAESVADARYAGVSPPAGESLKDVMPRVRAVFAEHIAPLLKERRHVLVVAHGNSLRALVKDLQGIGDDDIVNEEIPTGKPLLYELDAELKPLSRQFLSG